MKLTKKSLIGFVTIGALFVSATPAFAINGTGLDKDGNPDPASDQATTNGEATFILDDGTGPVVDPTDEPNIITPQPPASTIGQLRINQAPTLKFGEIQIKGTHTATNAQFSLNTKADGTTERYIPNYLQVNDTRGDAFGWTVKASATDLVRVDGTGVPVTGAFITFKDATVVSASGMDATDATLTPVVPTALNTIAPGQANIDGIKLDLATPQAGNSASQVDMFKADASGTQGINIWTSLYGGVDEAYDIDATNQNDPAPTNSTIQLHVPSGAKKTPGDYKSVITWEMSNTPA
ncbi:WxL domain-containing protein [Carnobacterium gallinarum]|uniref:WxL domain-containing protein n=1 Tax=Carnobacterium gallinarum TaxID=2749 RepID=UPI000557000A|nr:WxL domain-containing protein [Carnobacterium gallinarum]